MRLLPALLLSLVCLPLAATDSHAFLDFFKKDLDKVPESEEMRAMEAAAKLKVTEAMEYETAGKTDKAFDIYKDVVKKYPVTTSAAMSQVQDRRDPEEPRGLGEGFRFVPDVHRRLQAELGLRCGGREPVRDRPGQSVRRIQGEICWNLAQGAAQRGVGDVPNGDR